MVVTWAGSRSAATPTPPAPTPTPPAPTPAPPTPTPEPPPDDPADGHTITGTLDQYEQWSCGNVQLILVGTLDDGRWYVQSTGAGEDYLWGNAATVECLQGEHWEKLEDGLTDKEGCVSDSPEERDLIVLMGIGGWVVIDNSDGTHIARLTPRSSRDLWLPLGSEPYSR
jgi:hypothetical protein